MGKTDTSKKEQTSDSGRPQRDRGLPPQANDFQGHSPAHPKGPLDHFLRDQHHRSEHRNSFTTENGTCPNLLKAPFVCNGCQKRDPPLPATSLTSTNNVK